MTTEHLAQTWLKQCSLETQLRVSEKVTAINFPAGRRVHDAESKAEGLYCIAEGTIRISASNVSGKQLIVRNLTAGDWFGFIGCFGSGRRPNHAHATVDSKLLYLKKSDFESIADSDPQAWKSIVGILAQYVEYFYSSYENTLFLPLNERLESTIRQLCDWQKNPRLEISQSELADMLGVTKEAIGINLNILQSNGIVELGYRSIVYK